MKVLEKFIHVDKWRKLIMGSAVALSCFLLIYSNGLEESLVIQQGIIYLAVPVAYALIGLLEIVTGVPFSESAKRWERLAGWQRAVFGITVVVFLFALFLLGVVALAE